MADFLIDYEYDTEKQLQNTLYSKLMARLYKRFNKVQINLVTAYNIYNIVHSV